MKRKRIQIAALVVGLVGSAWLSAASEARLEYQVKAAFLYNFAKFVEWPDGTFDAADEPFVLCVEGDERFATHVEQVVDGRSAHGRPIDVRRGSHWFPGGSCHLAFLDDSEPESLARIVHSLADAAVLTVGATDSFVETGGMIGLVIEAGKVRFEINARSAERVGLKMSSQLLKLARSVKR